MELRLHAKTLWLIANPLGPLPDYLWTNSELHESETRFTIQRCIFCKCFWIFVPVSTRKTIKILTRKTKKLKFDSPDRKFQISINQWSVSIIVLLQAGLCSAHWALTPYLFFVTWRCFTNLFLTTYNPWNISDTSNTNKLRHGRRYFRRTQSEKLRTAPASEIG